MVDDDNYILDAEVMTMRRPINLAWERKGRNMKEQRLVDGWIIGTITILGPQFLNGDHYWRHYDRIEEAYVHPKDFFETNYNKKGFLTGVSYFGIPAIYEPGAGHTWVFGTRFYAEVYEDMIKERRRA